MAATSPEAPLSSMLTWSGRAAIALVLVFATLNTVGWATGIDVLTRGLPGWPRMTPWSALLLAALALAVLVQTSRPSAARLRVGRGLAAATAVMAALFLAEYATGRPLGLDAVWFSDAVRGVGGTWPGRPSPQTAVSVLLLSIGAGLTRAERHWARVVWPLATLAAVVVPSVALGAYLYDALSLVTHTRSTGMGISTAVGLVLLVVATFVARPDRKPLAWLLARPDARTLLRLGAVVAGLPLLQGLSRLAFLTVGLREGAALVLSVFVGTVVFGAATFYISQREQKLLIDREQVSRERAEAQAQYRILADNLVDVVVLLNGATVVHLKGNEVAWISPSVQAAFGDPPPQWIGSDFSSRIHPDDIDAVEAALGGLASGDSVVTRFRVSNADAEYHWVDGHCKPYVDADGETDGVLMALRLVDELVAAERQLQRLARFDALTGLVNRGEAISRLRAALDDRRAPGPHLGVLFCDLDHFKAINDTWGHAAGDVVLATTADRIRACVREEDTVGRTGGDEMLVLLPGIHNLEEVIAIAEKIRCHASEPIHHEGNTIHTTMSIGAAVSTPGESADALTARADAAMYRAKQAGRNTVTHISGDG